MRSNVRVFAPEYSAVKAGNRRPQPARVVFLFVLTIAAVSLLATASYATGNIGKADLSGPWVEIGRAHV